MEDAFAAAQNDAATDADVTEQDQTQYSSHWDLLPELLRTQLR